MFYTAPLVSRHSHSCKVNKGHSSHQRAGKGCRKVGHGYPGWEKRLHGLFWGASPGCWRVLPPWPLNSRHASTQAWGTGKPPFPTSNATHQHDTMSFPVCKVPQDRHEPVSGKQPANKRGEVTGSCWSRRTWAVNQSWVWGKGIFPLEQQRDTL